ncbi:MAG: hypothetical protein JNL82_05750 [Myxococcales bacterium]|nr:hypothetical protein [Myxococcales bacterium]
MTSITADAGSTCSSGAAPVDVSAASPVVVRGSPVVEPGGALVVDVSLVDVSLVDVALAVVLVDASAPAVVDAGAPGELVGSPCPVDVAAALVASPVLVEPGAGDCSAAGHAPSPTTTIHQRPRIVPPIHRPATDLVIPRAALGVPARMDP